MKPIVRPLAVMVLGAIALVACSKDDAATTTPSTAPADSPVPAGTAETAETATPAAAPLRVVEVQMARAVDADLRAAEPTTTFAPADGIFAVVLTEGAGSGILAARWTYGADRQPVYQEEHRIEATGPGVNNFRITKPDGFPTGDYQVDIMLDGTVALTRQFKVQ